MKKVIEIYYEDKPTGEFKHYRNGLIIVLEDGTKLEMNCCEQQCLEPFSRQKP